MGIVIRDNVMPGSSPSTFALVGVTALLVGVQRSTVSLCIILMEGTGETKFLIPIVVTTVAAKWVGDNFNEGVYEIGMEVRGGLEGARGRQGGGERRSVRHVHITLLTILLASVAFSSPSFSRRPRYLAAVVHSSTGTPTSSTTCGASTTATP